MGKTKHSFKEGVSGNPNGRPKGSFSPLRKQLLELRKRAANDIEEAYNILWKDFKAGDPLAKQIYFKELVSMPKEWLSETVVVASEEGVDRLEALTQALPQFSELTHDEAINELRMLRQIKMDPISTFINESVVETEEEHEKRMKRIKLFCAWEKEREKQESLNRIMN